MGNEWGYYDAHDDWIADTYAGAVTRAIEDVIRDQRRAVDKQVVGEAIAKAIVVRRRHEWSTS